jgi:hypothetical protein
MKRLRHAVIVLIALSSTAAQAKTASLAPTGGLTIAGAFQPLVFTWSSPMGVTGSGWERGEFVAISIVGPLNAPGVSASELSLGSLVAGSKGNLSGSLAIPYDGGFFGPAVRIPRPGSYMVKGKGSASGTITASALVNLSPATSTVAGAIDWARERGGRDGVFPSFLHPFSPERTDPEWTTVWSEDVVTLAGTVAERSVDGAGVQVSHTDDPGHHYAHDWNFFVLPDPSYTWVAGTKNFFETAPGQSPGAVVEVEWEAQNAGNAFTYGLGPIGLPDFAVPSAGDRVVVAGRWIADTGHPEEGAHTEIHPPRFLATVRARPAVTSVDPTGALRVDVYVSGHGGGANQVPVGLSATLDQGGAGGGRVQDALVVPDQDLYERAGPFPSTPFLDSIVFSVSGQHLLGPVFPTAGPSAFSWGGLAPEAHAINDRDYDFDVPLPRAPDDAASPRVEVITRPGHTTSVGEVITYGNFDDGLPTTAHVHLPYRGADNGVYARTLLFAWDAFRHPGKHFRVTLDRVHVTGQPGRWHLWSDVSGQWTNLTNVAPALFGNVAGQTIPIGASYDVRVADGDTVRVFAQGYSVGCFDNLFGQLFGLDVYSQRLATFNLCGFGDSVSLGDVTLALPPRPSSSGSYAVAGPNFTLDVSVTYVPGS